MQSGQELCSISVPTILTISTLKANQRGRGGSRTHTRGPPVSPQHPGHAETVTPGAEGRDPTGQSQRPRLGPATRPAGTVPQPVPQPVPRKCEGHCPGRVCPRRHPREHRKPRTRGGVASPPDESAVEGSRRLRGGRRGPGSEASGPARACGHHTARSLFGPESGVGLGGGGGGTADVASDRAACFSAPSGGLWSGTESIPSLSLPKTQQAPQNGMSQEPRERDSMASQTLPGPETL